MTSLCYKNHVIIITIIIIIIIIMLFFKRPKVKMTKGLKQS